MIPIFKGKGDAMSCGAYRGVKLLEHAMKRGLPEALVRAVMSLYEGAKTRVRVG